MSATIMLATNFDIDKTTFPVYVSEKMDGVPVKIFWTSKGWKAVTRQGKPVMSIDHILEQFGNTDLYQCAFVGELVKPNATFEETSGLVRQTDCSPELELMLYDYFRCDELGNCTDNWEFERRLNALVEVRQEFFYLSTSVKLMLQYACESPADLEGVMKNVKTWANNAGRTGSLFEGWVIRSMDGPDSVYKQGKRSRGLQRIVPEPTVDLKVVDVVEAIDIKTKQPKGMVGSLECVDGAGIHYFVGAGKMPHDQRRLLFEDPAPIIGCIATVKYKPSTYLKLRQPTFQRFHPYKSEPDTI